ncbi:hypothetical protein ABZ807_19545 [Micromonospora sp. NPDC047548]|uniref:hypothetical protein n=1 Tax=Micromonospora sp. NPDC047548 TaxID=3155624 RepID=UPI0033CEE44E
MPRPLVIDEASTVALVNQFNDTVEDQQTARQNLNNISTNLAANWKSDSASPVFQQGLDAANRALNRIAVALRGISDEMVAFAQDTRSTEDDNAVNSQQVLASFGNGSWAG